MKSKLAALHLAPAIGLIIHLGLALNTTFAQGTAFTYQGRLNDGALPASGSYDLRFALFDNNVGNNQQGPMLTNSATAVSNGLFTATLDFGNQFAGANRWLEIGVRTNAGGAFTTLTPRQPLMPAPYAVTAGSVVSGGLAAGTYSNAMVLNNAANNLSGSFNGNGSGLTSLNASQLTSGAVPNSVLSNTVALLDRDQTFTGVNRFNSVFGLNVDPAFGLDVNQTITLYDHYFDFRAANVQRWRLWAPALGGFQVYQVYNASSVGVGQARLFIADDGAVGIGTTTPSKPLAVQKRATKEPAIMVGGAFAGGPRIQTYGLDADAKAWMGLGSDMDNGPYEHSLYFPVGNNNGRFTVGSYDGTNYSTKLQVDINGNVRWGNGSLLSSDANGLIELGSPNSAAQQPIIDFHFGVGSVQDFNVRIINDLNENLTIVRAGSATPMARFNSGGLTVNGTFVSSSDRNVKENFQPISSGSVLEKVAALPISKWNYKDDKSSEHIGPMAQDFYAAFNVGPDDKHITTVDEGGVALAAIQGLNQKLEETRAENAALKQQLAELKQLVQSLVPRH
jgi:hypothetical protein